MKRLLAPALVTLVVVAVVGCDDDPAKPKNKVPPSDYENLTEEWHVLNNLELAYDDRNTARYSELFDKDNFVFIFNPGDVGEYIPEDGTWGYAEDIQSATNMFTSEPGVENNPILTIDLTLIGYKQAQWTDLTSDEFPGETLRQTTVNYDYYIDTAQDRQFITSGTPSAQFVVRKIDGKWKLVQWFDLSGS